VIRLANEIAVQFAHKPHDAAVESIAKHINSFWDPRMRGTLAELAPTHRGELDDLAYDALPSIRQTPPPG
jgi:formate dehydrogenase subunit delta